MKQNKKIVNIQPDPSLFSKLGKTKYTIPKAISEIIDNSLDNRQKDKSVDVEISFQIYGDEIKIKDNAKGMDEDELVNALKIGYHKSDNINTIGEYGFGLKSATSYLGKKIFIYTKKINSKQIIKFEYDEKSFMDLEEAWNVEIEFLTNDDVRKEIGEELDTGTIIIIRDLNVTLYPALELETERGRLIPSLQRLYMLALGRLLNIRLNIKKKNGDIAKEDYNIEPYKFSNRMFESEFTFDILSKGSYKRVKGDVAVLDPSTEKNKKKNIGIYTFNGFLLTKNGKIIGEKENVGYKPHPEMRLVTGLIELQEFITTNTKDAFIKNYEWELLNDIMEKTIIKSIKKISNSTFIKNSIRANLDKGINPDINTLFKNDLEKNISNIDSDLAEKVKNFDFNIHNEVWENYIIRYNEDKKKYLDEDDNEQKKEDIDKDNKKEDIDKDNKKEDIDKDNKKEDIDKDNKKEKYDLKNNKDDDNKEKVIKDMFEIKLTNMDINIIHKLDGLKDEEVVYIWDNIDNNIIITTNTNNSKFDRNNYKLELIINNIENSIFEYFIVKNSFGLNKEVILGIRKLINKEINLRFKSIYNCAYK